MYITHFTVQGKGTFPLDMLRYDQATPRDSEAVSEIASSLLSLYVKEIDRTKVRVVNLNVYHPVKSRPGITDARWSSFGWTVFHVEEARKVS